MNLAARDALFRPLSITELAFMNAMAQGGALELHQMFERPRDVSQFAAKVLTSSEYCEGCAHRRVYHDGGTGNCHYDECPCTCFFETKSHNE